VWITYWHPLKAEDGAILGINVAAEEITEQKRAKAALQLANESLEARTLELTSSLEELRDAQDRLVQTKKLASLGQLTAGIAHEIKNPLNFVNNFSSLSIELAVELQEAIKFQEFNDEKRTEIHDLLDMLRATLAKSCSTAGVRTRSCRTCFCIRARSQESTGLSISTHSWRKVSISPITGHGQRKETSISPWSVPLTRPPAKSICFRRRSRGCCST
jgi:Signal transduction histidine kinase regulating C4-dicarboxylate transport system